MRSFLKNKLQLAQETMKRLRSRRCVQRVVMLRLNVSEAKLLSETLMAAVRECDDTDTNRPTILLCDLIYRKLQKQIEREQHNAPSSPHCRRRDGWSAERTNEMNSTLEREKDSGSCECSVLLAAARPNSPNAMAEDGRMLDHLLEVQRILTRNKDQKRLALLHPLTDSLQDEYLEHLEAAVKGG